MAASVPQRASLGGLMKLSPIREFGLRALLWLPLAFVLWFAFSSPLIWPVVQMSKVALIGLWPEIFSDLRPGGEIYDGSGKVLAWSGYLVQLSTKILTLMSDASGRSGVAYLEPVLNPMVYGYSLPLFVGLAMATPIGLLRRIRQFALALVVIWLAQSFGLVAEALKVIAFSSGPPGEKAIAAAGLPLEGIALTYQFGYLILPAVVPIALWIGLNRDFIELLIRKPPVTREPAMAEIGQNPIVPPSGQE
ncbi:MAG: exosortase H-associated membrane protein [Dokdonella sp.]